VTLTTFDKLLMAVGVGLWLTLILLVVAIFIAVRRGSDAVDACIAYQSGWTDDTLDALRAHGPTTDHPDARLLWLVAVEPSEPNPYLTEDRSR
jgi:hypothetical protein